MIKNNWLKKISKTAMRKAGRAELVIKKNSPEILLGIGIISFVGTVVSACKATTRADEVLEYHKRKIKDFHDAKEIADQNPDDDNYTYDPELYRMDVGVQFLKTTGNLAKLYAPSVALGGLSLACIIASRNIMKNRYVGLLAAYNGVTAAFEQYRNRVRDEYGEDLDRHFRYGTTYDTLNVVNVDEDGKKNKNKVNVEMINSSDISNADTCRFFDQSNPNWDRNPANSMMWLRAQQNILNDILHSRGHVFLNEAYDALGFPHTPEGAILGWIDGEDEYINLGLLDYTNDQTRRFVNGVDNVILLTFNHNSDPIWEKI